MLKNFKLKFELQKLVQTDFKASLKTYPTQSWVENLERVKNVLSQSGNFFLAFSTTKCTAFLGFLNQGSWINGGLLVQHVPEVIRHPKGDRLQSQNNWDPPKQNMVNLKFQNLPVVTDFVFTVCQV